MKQFIRILAIPLLLIGVCAAQSKPYSESFGVGQYYSPNYNFGNSSGTPPLKVAIGTSSSGAGTLTLQYGYFTLPDGRIVQPFTNVSTFPAITIDPGSSTQETVTPSSASCSTPQSIQTCSITATFTYAHPGGDTIVSGDYGIQEAINDAANAGGGAVFWFIDTGNVTLSTSGANTNLGSVNIPTRSTVLGASARVTTTIGTCAGGWSLGFSTGTEFTAANTTLTAGTTTDSSTLSVPVAFNAAATVPIAHCTTSNASAGAIHAVFWGTKIAAPAY